MKNKAPKAPRRLKIFKPRLKTKPPKAIPHGKMYNRKKLKKVKV